VNALAIIAADAGQAAQRGAIRVQLAPRATRLGMIKDVGAGARGAIARVHRARVTVIAGGGIRNGGAGRQGRAHTRAHHALARTEALAKGIIGRGHQALPRGDVAGAGHAIRAKRRTDRGIGRQSTDTIDARRGTTNTQGWARAAIGAGLIHVGNEYIVFHIFFS